MVWNYRVPLGLWLLPCFQIPTVELVCFLGVLWLTKLTPSKFHLFITNLILLMIQTVNITTEYQ